MRIPTVHAIALFAAVLLAASAAAFASERAGDRATERGEYRIAIREYEEALERDPDDVDVLTSLARVKTHLAGEVGGSEAAELYQESAEHARRATELAPENPETHFERARALGRLAEFRGIFETLDIAATVREELERTLELDPDHAGALHALALWHHHVPWIAGGRTGEIRPLFERAIEIEPENISHRRAFGEVLIEIGELEAGREQLEAALEIEAETFVGQREQERARELLEEHF